MGVSHEFFCDCSVPMISQFSSRGEKDGIGILGRFLLLSLALPPLLPLLPLDAFAFLLRFSLRRFSVRDNFPPLLFV